MSSSRCFNDESYDQKRWDTQEKDKYIARVKLAGVTTFMTNYLADTDVKGGAFGGAMVIRGDGKVIKTYPLGISGMLLVEL